jgi:hypothetical protein
MCRYSAHWVCTALTGFAPPLTEFSGEGREGGHRRADLPWLRRSVPPRVRSALPLPKDPRWRRSTMPRARSVLPLPGAAIGGGDGCRRRWQGCRRRRVRVGPRHWGMRPLATVARDPTPAGGRGPSPLGRTPIRPPGCVATVVGECTGPRR